MFEWWNFDKRFFYAVERKETFSTIIVAIAITTPTAAESISESDEWMMIE